MCGRYYRRSDKQRIAEAFEVKGGIDDLVLPDWNYNVAPSTLDPATFQPVIRSARDTGEREIVMMKWGLIPFYVKRIEAFKGYSTINARAETVATKPAYRQAFKRRRCLVPADGFYEWLEPKPKHKVPYAISLTRPGPFAIAGIWDASKSPEGDWLQSFSMIVTDPNEAVEPFHDRMPVILRPNEYDRWLSRDDTAPLPIDLLRIWPAEETQVAEANRIINSTRNQGVGPEALMPTST
jgi:putative SOS response-associated peptidase YedK